MILSTQIRVSRDRRRIWCPVALSPIVSIDRDDLAKRRNLDETFTCEAKEERQWPSFSLELFELRFHR